MKKILPFLVMITSAVWVNAQVTSPIVRGLFGVDGDVEMDLFTTSFCTDCDDWFFNHIASSGTSYMVIDTTGAGAIVKSYKTSIANRQIPFYRKMPYNAYEQFNNRTMIDAVFVRDYHGVDYTTFATSNKNGMSPADWQGATGSVPDKCEILDAYVHIRRAGPTYTTADTLWMYGALALENTNGDRYFDFELYQTDIFYTRSTQKFTGYGPDAGHTTWKFDATGHVTQPGDITLSANYGSSTLTSIEARIWVDTASLHITPATFSWTGVYAGANNNSQYVYAGIQSKNGEPFYFGTENGFGSSWAGPFKLVRANDSVVTSYAQNQLMEFGVNMTTLGLDPVTLLGKTQCGIPFSRVLIKTRSSVSFQSNLQDFIGPFDLFLPPQATAAADIPIFCGSTGVSTITVTNPYPTSSYLWTTPDGHIVGANSGTSIQVDQPGNYIVKQILESGCPTYAADTVAIVYDPSCAILPLNQLNFRGVLNNGTVDLGWTATRNQDVKSFTVERSVDGVHFFTAGTVDQQSSESQYAVYATTNDVFNVNASYIYYRLKITGTNGAVQYSNPIRVALNAGSISEVTIGPNPVKDLLQINVASNADKDVQVFIYSATGQLMKTLNTHVAKGYSIIKMNDLGTWAQGVYSVKVLSGKDVFINRMVLTK